MQKEKKNNGIEIIPQRLRDARIAANRTIKDVAQEIGVTAQVLSMYELGRCNPSMEIFFKLKNLYNLPAKYYTKPYKENIGRSQVYFRSFSSATKGMREISLKKAEWLSREIVCFLKGKIKFPEVDELFSKIKKSINVEKKRDVEILAKIIRREWGLGLTPIGNLTRELEKRGVIIVIMDLDDKIDGFSFWEEERPFVFVNKNNGAIRLRMSIAHELCHLFFHEAEDVEKHNKDLEVEAKRFASALLMPDSSFAKDVCSTSLEQLFYLKPKWKTSVASMVMRCEQLGLANEFRITYLQKQISRKHWRKEEPDDHDYEHEKPIVLKQAIELLVDRKAITKEELLDSFGLDSDFIEETCALDKGYLNRDDRLVNLRSIIRK